MNVLMLGWEFPPQISGGLGTACEGIVKGLTAFNDVHVLFVVPKTSVKRKNKSLEITDAEFFAQKIYSSSYYNPGTFTQIEIPSELLPYDNPEEMKNMKHFSGEDIFPNKKRVKLSNEKDIEYQLRFTGGYGVNLFSEINKYSFVIQELAKRESFDIIHSHDWITFPAGVRAREISGKPLVVHVHSTDFDRSGELVNPTIFEIERNGFLSADRIITVSNRVKRMLIEKYGIPPQKITTVYNAVEQASTQKIHRQKHTEKIVTFMGRITFQKGPGYFLEVAEKILRRMKNVHFVMAGNGDLMTKMVGQSVKLGISNKFSFTGFLKGSETKRLLAMSDVFIMPSYSEPFGITPLEAMQAGVPVIISLQSGVSEILRNVVKADFWDTDAMADAVHSIISRKPLAKVMAMEGWQEVSNLSWSNTSGTIRDIYLSAV